MNFLNFSQIMMHDSAFSIIIMLAILLVIIGVCLYSLLAKGKVRNNHK